MTARHDGEGTCGRAVCARSAVPRTAPSTRARSLRRRVCVPPARSTLGRSHNSASVVFEPPPRRRPHEAVYVRARASDLLECQIAGGVELDFVGRGDFGLTVFAALQLDQERSGA